MARAPVGRIARKSGINPLPIIIFVLVAALAGAGLFTWDYLYRRRQEEATRPPAPEVVVKNLVENIIGRGTVKEAKIDQAAGIVTVTFESATFKPDQPKEDSREFISAEAKLASDVILIIPDQLAAAVPVLKQVKRVDLTLVYQGATLATATAVRNKEVQVTFVDPRLK
ncbi:MAG: hypothetical protein HY334_02015 [Armatimonadetes bacterium]|nr:hypothetical protein [Armatimonadota bacterium]